MHSLLFLVVLVGAQQTTTPVQYNIDLATKCEDLMPQMLSCSSRLGYIDENATGSPAPSVEECDCCAGENRNLYGACAHYLEVSGPEATESAAYVGDLYTMCREETDCAFVEKGLEIPESRWVEMDGSCYNYKEKYESCREATDNFQKMPEPFDEACLCCLANEETGRLMWNYDVHQRYDNTSLDCTNWVASLAFDDANNDIVRWTIENSWSLQYYCGSYDNKLCNGKPVSESKSEIEKGSATGSATSSATSTVSKVTIEPSTTTLSEVKPTAAASLRVGAVSGVLSLVALLVMW